ncbi:MAG: cupin domain-containing protein [Acidobacteriota bacterium]|nr:cupin domain-containing protein [Acidobacteriota bacterium]
MPRPSPFTKNLFGRVADAEIVYRSQEHGGTGPLQFRRIFPDDVFQSPIDFVDFTTIPAGSTIGRHEHHGNEELYYVARGNPTIILNGEKRELEPGGFAIVRDGECHELINATGRDVDILVIQVRIPQ